MIKYYETESGYYKINFDNRRYDVIHKKHMHICTDYILPYGYNVIDFIPAIYKEITEEQYNYMLEI